MYVKVQRMFLQIAVFLDFSFQIVCFFQIQRLSFMNRTSFNDKRTFVFCFFKQWQTVEILVEIFHAHYKLHVSIFI